MGDSLGFEILPYEEAESLKKDYSYYSNRIEALKRKLALESKLRDAAQSLSRLDDQDGTNGSIYGQNSAEQQYSQTSEELTASTRKCEELAQEIWKLERKAQSLHKRILEHTAGVLQLTHKGLKKNLKRNDNQEHNSGSLYGDSHGATNGITEFDDRSLYKSAAYHDDINGAYGSRGIEGQNGVDFSAIQETKKKLEDLNSRMRGMILQVNPNQYLDPIPQPSNNGEESVNHTAALQAHLAYLENGLNVIDSNQAEGFQGSDKSALDTEERLEEINSQLRDILKDAASSQSQSPALTPPPGATGRLQAQLSYLGAGIDSFKRRVEDMTEQKDILKTQIQQQRELNSKSDAQRDAHIGELSEEIERLKKELDLSEREGQGTRDELTLVMEQLDASRQGAMLDEQDRSVSQADKEALRQAEERSRAKDDEMLRLEGEKNAIEENSRAKDNEISRLEAEKDALQQSESNSHSKDNEISRLEASISQLRTEKDQEMKDNVEAREKAEEEVKRMQAELSDLEGETIRAQTELTIARAELDGAYGSRSERAAAVAANPAVRQELDELNERNANLITENAALKAEQGNKSNNNSGVQERVQTLEKELRETIEDYEVMTKASIEFEKERDKLENVIDELRDRCESLESQLNEDKIQWLGNNNNGPPSAGARDGMPSETTSTTVLKNEFKKIMRDTRQENMKAIKVGCFDVFVC